MDSEANSRGRDESGAMLHRGDIAEHRSTSLLVDVALSQSQAAFEELFDEFASRIYRLGMKLARNEQIAKDLVQDVMLHVWQHANDFDMDRGTAQSWIFSLSRNKCIDMLRKANRHAVQLPVDDIWPDYQQEQLAAELDETEAGVEKLNSLGRIDSLLTRLPAPQCEAVKMVYVNDLNHEEASSRLKIPLGTFKSRLRLGLSKLRKMVKVRHD